MTWLQIAGTVLSGILVPLLAYWLSNRSAKTQEAKDAAALAAKQEDEAKQNALTQAQQTAAQNQSIDAQAAAQAQWVKDHQ